MVVQLAVGVTEAVGMVWVVDVMEAVGTVVVWEVGVVVVWVVGVNVEVVRV